MKQNRWFYGKSTINNFQCDNCGIHGNEEADAFARSGSSSVFVEPEPCLPLAPSSVRRRERYRLFKSHCASWSLQTRMWLKKPNPRLTRYLLRLPSSKLRILVGLITGHCPLNKHLHNMGLLDKPINIACSMEDESAFHLLYNCPSLISLRVRTFLNRFWALKNMRGRLRMHCCDSRWQKADSLWLLNSFILMNTSSLCTV
jgi:hypothetical protein